MTTSVDDEQVFDHFESISLDVFKFKFELSVMLYYTIKRKQKGCLNDIWKVSLLLQDKKSIKMTF